jgi:hypothetical protein
MGHIKGEPLLEEFRREVLRPADCGGVVAVLSGPILGILNEVGSRTHRQRWRVATSTNGDLT